MTDKEYFARPEVSNSELKNLSRLYRGDTRNIEEEYKEALVIGSLVDAHITGEIYVGESTYEQRELAYVLYKYMIADALIKIFLSFMEGQVKFFEVLTFEYDGITYQIAARCKFDLFSHRFKIGVEIKTTACTTRKSFILSIEFLDYDQAAAWYMDIAKIDRLWIIGISKKTKEIFKFAIERGDETYTRGKAKYCFRAFQWIMFIDGFIEPLNITPLLNAADQIPGGNRILASDDDW